LETPKRAATMAMVGRDELAASTADPRPCRRFVG